MSKKLYTSKALKIIYELIIYAEENSSDEDFADCWKAYQHLQSKLGDKLKDNK
tara:strand:- start:425 stop:583 length:159 start_codon:yes stop_codon:yes gene_type:complete